MPDGALMAAERAAAAGVDPAADRAALACIFTRAARGQAGGGRPVCHALGLAPAALARLIGRHPTLAALVPPGNPGRDAGPDTPEEEDLRHLLLTHAAPGPDTPAFAAIIARACQGSEHLWQDLGLTSRSQLTALLERHVPALAALNTSGMKWKKFFYRQLCEREGIPVCPAPNCRSCCDRGECFGGEG